MNHFKDRDRQLQLGLMFKHHVDIFSQDDRRNSFLIVYWWEFLIVPALVNTGLRFTRCYSKDHNCNFKMPNIWGRSITTFHFREMGPGLLRLGFMRQRLDSRPPWLAEHVFFGGVFYSISVINKSFAKLASPLAMSVYTVFLHSPVATVTLNPKVNRVLPLLIVYTRFLYVRH